MNNGQNIYQFSKTTYDFNITNKPYLTKKKGNSRNCSGNFPLTKSSQNFHHSKAKKHKSSNHGILETRSFCSKNITDNDLDHHFTKLPQKKPVLKKLKCSDDYTELHDGLIKGYYIKGRVSREKLLENKSTEIGNCSSFPLEGIQNENHSNSKDNCIFSNQKNITRSCYFKKNVPDDKTKIKSYNYLLNQNKKINNNQSYSTKNSSFFIRKSNNSNKKYLNKSYCQKALIKMTDSTDYDINDTNNENSSYYNNIDYNKNKKHSIENKQNNNNRYGKITKENKRVTKEPKISNYQKQEINTNLNEIINLSHELENLHNESFKVGNGKNKNAKIIQDFIRNILKKNICAIKIQAFWRGTNIRKVVNLYNDLDEFIYHISKVNFLRFRNIFYFFISQLFNKYEENIKNDISEENDVKEYKNINKNNDIYKTKMK